MRYKTAKLNALRRKDEVLTKNDLKLRLKECQLYSSDLFISYLCQLNILTKLEDKFIFVDPHKPIHISLVDYICTRYRKKVHDNNYHMWVKLK